MEERSTGGSMSFTVISFYTVNTPYEKEIQKLIASLDMYNVKHSVSSIQTLGSWEKNCQHKARCILHAMETIETNIVWLDADAVITRYPSLFDELECDLAYHYLEHRKELLSGTLFLANNERMRELVREWIALNDTNRAWDQKNLQSIVENRNNIAKQVLPAAYCKIYDNRHQQVTDPVVMHYQASRRYKRAVGTYR